jgi:hypothetical protein
MNTNNDMRCRHWYVQIPGWDTQPTEKNLKIGTADKLEARWLEEERILHLLYSFKHPTQKSTLKSLLLDPSATFRETTAARYASVFGDLSYTWKCCVEKPKQSIVPNVTDENCAQSRHNSPSPRNCDRDSTSDSEADEIHKRVVQLLGERRQLKRRLADLERVFKLVE